MMSAEDDKLYETVVLSYVAYKTTRNEGQSGTRKDWKSAMAASAAAYHFREHLPERHKKSRKQIVDLCADYALLGDVVDASKHKVLTRKKPPPQIASMENIRELMVSTRYG
jgi:hypothetical protein